MRAVIYIFLFSIFFSSCKDEIVPKPKGYLKLEYPQSKYSRIKNNCPFSFEISKSSNIKFNSNCWSKIHYPNQNATIHITYRRIYENIEEILKETEKLTFTHTIKADAISERPYDDISKKIYAKLYNIDGDVATNIQFRATDSVKNILVGALYFNTTPNYDSITPAIKFIEKDIIHLIETLEWK